MLFYVWIVFFFEVDMQYWQKGDNEMFGEVFFIVWSLVFCDEMWI